MRCKKYPGKVKSRASAVHSVGATSRRTALALLFTFPGYFLHRIQHSLYISFTLKKVESCAGKNSAKAQVPVRLFALPSQQDLSNMAYKDRYSGSSSSYGSSSSSSDRYYDSSSYGDRKRCVFLSAKF